MLTMVDNITLLLCAVGILWVGKYFASTADSMDSFYSANRSLPWSLAVGTMVASWYGGAGVIGTTGYVAYMGISAYFIWSIGAHLVRFPLALWVGPSVSLRVQGTVPQMLERYYGKVVAVFGAIVLISGLMGIAEVATTGYVGEAAWGINKYIVAIGVLVVSVFIATMGGLMGVAVTDMIFFAVMIVSICAALPVAASTFGGWAEIVAVLEVEAPLMLSTFGGTPPGRAVVLVLLCVNMYKDPTFYQRFAAANTPRTGGRALLIGFSIFLSFDVVNMMAGLLVRARNPEVVQPEFEYITLILENLPPVVRGLFIFGVFGAIISTIDTQFLVGGEIVAKDVVQPLLKKPLTDKQSINITRISCIVFACIAVPVAFMFPLVYDIMIFLSSLSMCALFVPLLAAVMYTGKKTNVAGLLSMVVGFLVWFYFTNFPLYSEALFGERPVDALVFGLPASLIAFIIGNNFGKVLHEDEAVVIK